jgi:hypothetical protein
MGALSLGHYPGSDSLFVCDKGRGDLNGFPTPPVE